MIILDTINKSLEVLLAGVVATSQLPLVASYVDVATTTYVPSSNDAASNDVTAVTLVAAPGASTQRQVKLITIYNADTAPVTVTVRLNNSGTFRILYKPILAVGSTLVYTDGEGFRVIGSDGSILGAGSPGATGPAGLSGPTGRPGFDGLDAENYEQPFFLVASPINNENFVTLVDGATPALDASLGSVFRLAAGGDRTIAVPTNAKDGKRIVIQHFASGAARTLALNTGAGGFRFGSDITALTQTASGKTDYIGAIYNNTDSKWDVVAVTKGF